MVNYLGKLQRSPECLSLRRVNNATLTSYSEAVAKFIHYCTETASVPRSKEQLDVFLAEFGNYLYQANHRRGQRQTFVNAVMGAELFCPHLKGHLQISRAVFAGWDKVEPRKSPPPIPEALLSVLVLLLRAAGFSDEALGVFLTFHALLRIGEIVRLKWDDILLPGDCRLPNSSTTPMGGVLIRIAKTGPRQFVPLSNQLLLCFLTRAKGQHSRSSNVVTATAKDLRRLYDWALEEAGCQHLGFVFHSLRHGGATSMYLKQVDMATIQATGRWKQTKTCASYVQAGRGLLLATNYPSNTLRAMGNGARRLGRLQEL